MNSCRKTLIDVICDGFIKVFYLNVGIAHLRLLEDNVNYNVRGDGIDKEYQKYVADICCNKEIDQILYYIASYMS